MFEFWRKKNEQIKGFKEIWEHFAEISSKNAVLYAKISSLQTDVDELRGRFNRKLKGLQAEEQKEDPKAQDLNRFSPFL